MFYVRALADAGASCDFVMRNRGMAARLPIACTNVFVCILHITTRRRRLVRERLIPLPLRPRLKIASMPAVSKTDAAEAVTLS
jgi:hypothetical protein